MQIIQGDCVANLKLLPEKIVQCCVTSPPYYGLRDYGTAQWEGGDTECKHSPARKNGDSSSTLSSTSRDTTGHKQEGYRGGICPKCGAVRIDEQIGLEQTPEQYVAKLVEVFREVRRVMKDDGTLWLNLGDSYAANRGYQVPDSKHVDVGNNKGMRAADMGLKPKDLIGIPWMVAFALRADGWYLRSDIIWHKPNPMPESVRDRPTKSHEYMFLLTKSQKYYYDFEAILEPAATSSIARLAQDVENQHGSDRVPGKTNGPMKAVGVKLTMPGIGPKHGQARDRGEEYKPMRGYKTKPQIPDNQHHGQAIEAQEVDGIPARNKRDVWSIPTRPYKGAHFATFPPALIEPCILAGSRVGDIVLDPFNGSGTTGEVALRLGRDYYGFELNPEYIQLSLERLKKVQIGLGL